MSSTSDCHIYLSSQPAQIGNAFKAPHTAPHRIAADPWKKQVTQRNGAPYLWASLPQLEWMRRAQEKPMNRFAVAVAAAAAAAREQRRHVAHWPRKAAAVSLSLWSSLSA